MIREFIRAISMFLLMVSLSGCIQLRAPQIDNIQAWLNPPNPPLADFRWQLEIGVSGYTDEVILYLVKEQYVFVSEEANVMIYDGQMIPKIGLLAGEKVDISQQDRPNTNLAEADSWPIERRVFVNNTLFETQQCTQWSEFINDKQTQTCVGQITYTNQRKRNSDGTVYYLKQYISYKNQFITLTKRY